jgi:hypothetical protein
VKFKFLDPKTVLSGSGSSVRPNRNMSTMAVLRHPSALNHVENRKRNARETMNFEEQTQESVDFKSPKIKTESRGFL